LPDKYEFPLFDGRQAVESQRKSGYKNTARAAREIIDSALESGAKSVWVILKRLSEGERAKRERRDAVSAVAFIDDGPVMGYIEDDGGIRKHIATALFPGAPPRTSTIRPVLAPSVSDCRISASTRPGELGYIRALAQTSSRPVDRAVV